MISKVLATYLVADTLFVLSGGLILGFALISKSSLDSHLTISNVAQVLLLDHCALIPMLANAVVIFVAFLLSLPAIVLPNDRAWLKMHGWVVVISAVFTLAVGLTIWSETFKIRSMVGNVWAEQSPAAQSLLQQKFNCCGFLNSTSPPFQTDQTCRTPLIAASKDGCVGAFSNFAGNFLFVIYSVEFAIVGVSVILLLCLAMVLKDRKERERYRLIDEKHGLMSI